MTWSLSHTIPYTTDADNHTALTYLFDTAFNNLSQISVSAHPSASATKRSFTRTSTNIIGGASYTEYLWADWASTSPTTLYLYNDNTYTTTPGDLGTSTRNRSDSALSSNLGTSSWKFWTSDQNPKALLVTRSKALMFYEPGFSSAVFYEDTAWSSGTETKRTHYFPGTRNIGLAQTGMPSANTAASTTEYTVLPSCSVSGSGSGYWGDIGRLDVNFPWLLTSAAGGSPGTGADFAFPSVGNDVVFYRPLTPSSTLRATFPGGSSEGLLWLIDGTYYLGVSSSSQYPQIMFNMGTSEPDLS